VNDNKMADSFKNMLISSQLNTSFENTEIPFAYRQILLLLNNIRSSFANPVLNVKIIQLKQDSAPSQFGGDMNIVPDVMPDANDEHTQKINQAFQNIAHVSHITLREMHNFLTEQLTQIHLEKQEE